MARFNIQKYRILHKVHSEYRGNKVIQVDQDPSPNLAHHYRPLVLKPTHANNAIPIWIPDWREGKEERGRCRRPRPPACGQGPKAQPLFFFCPMPVSHEKHVKTVWNLITS